MSIAGLSSQQIATSQAAADQAVANQAASTLASNSTTTGSTTGTTGTTGASSASSTALTGLSSNLNTFLNMLMTQLQNQDPTAPLDTAQFTNQLVEYSSVEQQIQSNTNLTQLISQGQANEVVQSAAIIGKTATVFSSQLALQSGTANVGFTATTAGPASILVTDTSGHQLATATVNATAGANSWTWNGENSSGNREPDGVYNVAVTQANTSGTSANLATTVTGTVTGVQSSGASTTLQLGGLSVAFSKLQSMATSQ